MRYVPGQYGPGHLSRDKSDGWSLHPRISRIQCHCYRRAKRTPQRSCSVLLVVTVICGRGHPTVQAENCRLPDGYGGAEMLHPLMLTRPQQHLDDRECCFRAQRAPPGIGVSSGGGIQCQPRPSRGRSQGVGYISGTGGGGIGIHVSPIPPATAPMVPGREDVEHGMVV